MSDVEVVSGGGIPAAPVAPVDTGPLTVRSAVDAFAKIREKAAKPETVPTDKTRAPNGTFAPKESAPATEHDAGPETVPSENADSDPVEVPSIEPPRSWSKEDKAHFEALPHETQQRIADRERARESDFLQRQNEAAEKTKALAAKEQAAEQARQHYEEAARNTLQALQHQQGQEFADIKSDADGQKLANEDPFRYVQWRARQDAIVGLHNQIMQANQQKQQEAVRTFETWSAEEDKKFTEHAPEFADPEKAEAARKEIVSYLTEVRGIPRESLPELWNNPIFRDHRTQAMVRDAAKWNAAQKKATAALPKPVPPVQRPGTAPDKGSQAQAKIETAKAKLTNATGIASVRAGLEVLKAQRAATRR